MNPRKTALFFFGSSALSIVLLACGGGGSDKGVLSGGGSSSGATVTSGQTSGSGTQSGSGSTSGSSDAKPTTAPSTSGSSSGGGNSDLAGVYANFAKQKSWRGTIKADTGATAGQNITIEFQQPDRSHITVSGGATGNVELISIGNDSYVKIAGTWTKQPGTGSKLFDTNSLSDGLKDAEKTGTKGGTDTVNGKKCQIYTTSTGTEICVADNLPLRIVSKSGTTASTIIFSDFGSNIEIKAPI